jgi:hypothetical protein
MLIKDLVAIDEHAEFRNDVQLSDYDRPETNLALLRSYLFTDTAPREQESSMSLLRMITSAFSDARTKNRFAVIANYGHGKSHLALVIANYYGKPYKSEEMRIIMGKIAQKVDNPARAAYFQEFRQNHPEYLVVRLRGDAQRTLREQFVTNLELALKEHQATRSVQLPFWYQTAENWLSGLSAENQAKANQFLEQYSTDVPLLLQDIRQRRDNAYDQSRLLHKHLHGTLPDFGGEVSLRELINWVAGKYCGDGKPLGGILVLFDEFSLYIQRYAQRNAAGELQDLLNGIQDQQGKSVFLAFAQQDPKTIAQNVMKGTQGLESLEKELSRIERSPKLYSLMESVIDSYLTQPEGKWRELRADPRARGPLARASDLTLELFSKRYEETLRWDTEKFDETVTKGCFPLHPLTTAMLCDLQLQAIPRAGNPRTVLGFVFEQINARQNQPALTDTQINWVLPISLVEYFGDYLPENVFLLYENTRRNLGPEASPYDIALLQALLLQEAGHLPVHKDTQLRFLAEAAGIASLDKARHHLKMLTERGCIRFDPGTKMNAFLSVSANPRRLEELLNQRLEGKSLTQELLKSLNQETTKPIAVDIGWGHPDDWQAEEVILTKEFFTLPRLREIVPPFKITYANELQEGRRGGVVWLLAQDEDEVNWFRLNAAKILAEAYPGDNPPPIILILPQKPCPELIQDYLRLKELEKLSVSDRKEVGVDVYEHEKSRLAQALVLDMAALREDTLNYRSLPRTPNTWIAPAAYLSPLQALGRVSIEQILKECYRNAYRFSPPEFFTQYPVVGKGQNRLRDATRMIAAALLRNSLGSNREAITVYPVAKDLIEKFLWHRWRLLTADYRIQEPEDQRILEGWNILEQQIPAGSRDVRVREALLTLFNPPFGFDYNTATLLLCTWIGYHMHDLELNLLGRHAKLDQLVDMLTDGSKKFVQQICCTQPLGISRRDKGQIIREIKTLIERANRDTFTQEEAQEAVTKLQSFCVDPGSQPDLCEIASQAAENLNTALKLAEDYDQKASGIITSIREERNLGDLIGLQHRISDLPHTGNVQYTAPNLVQLDQEWHNRLDKLVESECRRLEYIQRIAQIELHLKQLNDLKSQLKKAKLPELVKRVETALQMINERAEELAAQEREAPIKVEIRSMDTKAQLKTLYEYRQRLRDIDGCSPDTLKLRDDHLDLVKREIDQLESFAQGLQSATENLITAQDVRQWQQQFLRQIDRFQDTPYQEDLESANEKVSQIQTLIEELETVTRRSPINFQEAVSIVKRLDQILERAEPWAGSAQKQLIVDARLAVDHSVRQKMSEAHQWYLALEADFSKGAIVQVAEKLKSPPPFLPETDKPKLTDLANRVQRRIDEDVIVRIEAQFRQITDRTLRKQCLDRLRQIMDE